MSTYAVALLNHFNDEGLQLKVVTAENWREALETAFPGYLVNLRGYYSLTEAKTEAVNQDWEFDVVKMA